MGVHNIVCVQGFCYVATEACKALFPSTPVMLLNKSRVLTVYGLATQRITEPLLLVADFATCFMSATCGESAGHEELPKTLVFSVMCRLP